MSKAAKRKIPAKKSATKKAEKTEKKDEGAIVAPAAKVQMEPSPVAWVLTRHEGAMQERRAKGYSPGELASIGLNKGQALSLKVPIDPRRGSTIQANVDALKGWYKPAPKKPSVPKAEKAEKPAKPSKAAKKSAAKKS